MNRRMSVRARCAVAVAGLLMLAGCGKHEQVPPATLPAAASIRSTAVPAAAKSVGSKATPAAPAGTTAPAAATSAAPPAPAAVSAPFAILSLTLGDAVEADHRISHPGNRFNASDKTLYASVASTGSSSEVSLTASWRYLEGRGRLIREVSQSIATDGPAVTTFELHNPDLWPEGQYQVDISIDGKPATSQHFEITKSP